MDISSDDVQDTWELSNLLRDVLYEITEDIDPTISLAAMCNALVWCIGDRCEKVEDIMMCKSAILLLIDQATQELEDRIGHGK